MKTTSCSFVARKPQPVRRRGLTIRDLPVLLACLLVVAGLVTALGGANRDLSQASVCASNLETLFGGLMAYVNTYNSFPPNNPYPRWVNVWTSKNGIDSRGLDPSIGWIMTYGLAMTPPDTYINDPVAKSPHFKWYVLDQYHLPSVCVCPTANYDLLFTLNPELDTNSSESFVMQYAASYQCGGTCRSATAVKTLAPPGSTSQGGRNAPIPDPTYPFTSQVVDNAEGGVPYAWLYAKGTSNPEDPNDFGSERCCWVQAVHPAEVQEPSGLYYMADSREYRPTPNSWPPAAISSGWLNGYGNKIFLGTRHYGYANVMYLDGQVNRDNQAHSEPRWNMDYDPTAYQARSSQWRCSTFADPIPLAHISTQHHVMPVLMAKGWEAFFNTDGVAARQQ